MAQTWPKNVKTEHCPPHDFDDLRDALAGTAARSGAIAAIADVVAQDSAREDVVVSVASEITRLVDLPRDFGSWRDTLAAKQPTQM